MRMREIRCGPQVCGSLAEAAAREWLLSDGLGGFAMGKATIVENVAGIIGGVKLWVCL